MTKKVNLLWAYPAHLLSTVFGNFKGGGKDKLAAGFKQLHKSVVDKTQPQAQGYEMIVDGFRHLYGKSKQQLHEKLVKSYLSEVDDKWYKTVKVLVENAINSLVFAERPGPHDDLVCKLVPKIFDKLIAKTLVGVQPMSGPVSMNYRLAFIEGTESKMTLEILKDVVTAMSKKLQARLTPETVQGKKESHGFNLEAEIMDAIAGCIAEELNIELLAAIDQVATKVTHEGAFANIAPDHMALLIQGHANDIARGTRRGPANWIVVSSRVLKLLKGSSTFVERDEISKGAFQHVGTLLKTIQVYTYAFATTDVLIGFKGGSGEMDAGLFFNPYMLVTSSGVIIDPNSFNPIVTFMTRYGYTVAPSASSYYSTITFEKDEEAE